MSIGLDFFKAVAPMMGFVAVAAIGMEYLKVRLERWARAKRGPTTAERIQRLSAALTAATHTIHEIEGELSERSRLVQKLRDDCDRYDQLAKLKATEVEAVVQSLRGELRQEGRRGFWQSVLLNFIFFSAGVATTYLLGH